MKRLHRPDLFGWSQFNEDRNIDFHSVLWVRPEGNAVIDPLPLSPHDSDHLSQLGGVAVIVITNSDHVRDAPALAEEYAADVYGPEAERDSFPIVCDRWLRDDEEILPGLRAITLDGSKTPGELALLLEDTTLITGDLIRAHAAGRLHLLPDAKLADKKAAVGSVERLAGFRAIDAVLTGDGWPVFRDGDARLRDLVSEINAGRPSG